MQYQVQGTVSSCSAPAIRIITWNVNGIRSVVARFGGLKQLLQRLDSDVVCFQETKIGRHELDREVALCEGWHSFFAFNRSGAASGSLAARGRTSYSGVATFCKHGVAVPISAEEGFTGVLKVAAGQQAEQDPPPGSLWEGYSWRQLQALDGEGRCIVTTHGPLVVFNVYGPAITCSTQKLSDQRFAFKLDFYKALERRVRAEQTQGRAVLVLGDLNIAPALLDVPPARAMPAKEFSQREDRLWLARLMAGGDKRGGLVDVFRSFHPDRQEAYTCWSTASGARVNNYGSRIDLILAGDAMSNWPLPSLHSDASLVCKTISHICSREPQHNPQEARLAPQYDGRLDSTTSGSAACLRQEGNAWDEGSIAECSEASGKKDAVASGRFQLWRDHSGGEGLMCGDAAVAHHHHPVEAPRCGAAVTVGVVAPQGVASSVGVVAPQGAASSVGVVAPQGVASSVGVVAPQGVASSVGGILLGPRAQVSLAGTGPAWGNAGVRLGGHHVEATDSTVFSDAAATEGAANTLTSFTASFVAADIWPELEGSDHAPVWAHFAPPWPLPSAAEPPPLCTQFMFTGKQVSLKECLRNAPETRLTSPTAPAALSTSQLGRQPLKPQPRAFLKRKARSSGSGSLGQRSVLSYFGPPASVGSADMFGNLSVLKAPSTFDNDVAAIFPTSPPIVAARACAAGGAGDANGDVNGYDEKGGGRQASAAQDVAITADYSVIGVLVEREFAGKRLQPASPPGNERMVEHSVYKGEVLASSAPARSMAFNEAQHSSASPLSTQTFEDHGSPHSQMASKDGLRQVSPLAVAIAAAARTSFPTLRPAAPPLAPAILYPQHSLHGLQSPPWQPQILGSQWRPACCLGSAAQCSKQHRSNAQCMELASPNLSAGGSDDDVSRGYKMAAALAAWHRIRAATAPPLCTGHREPCVSRMVKKPGPNNGRSFFVCARADGKPPIGRCNFFLWASQWKAKGDASIM